MKISDIMIRTRGLRRTLGKVLGRVLGKQVSGDAEEAPQCRRLTTSTCRQRATATVVENVNHVDHVAEEVHEQPQELVTDHVGVDTKGFPDESHDTSVLTSYADHLAAKECTELKLASHGRKVEKFERSALKIEGIVTAIGLRSLTICSLEIRDRGLLSAFAKSFHLPIGELTITLDDVASLLHLSITDEAMDLLVELLEVSTQEAKDETEQCRGAYVCLAWLRDIYRSKYNARQWTLVAQAYLLHLVGCTLFTNKSVTHISVVFLDAFHDLSQSGGYSWEAVALVHMYDNLNVTSKHTTKHLAGYITLLHFGRALPVMTYRKRLDKLTSDVVCWIPYNELIWGSYIVRHQPKRVVRQFGYRILMIDDFNFHTILHQMDRFVVLLISHPFMSLTQLGDPHRHPSVVHDDTFIDTCQKIIESLEYIINMRMVTVEIEAKTLTKHYLRLAKGVIEQQNVYVWSR
ncbi:Protein MAIN-LIKE 1 [Glycine soja]